MLRYTAERATLHVCLPLSGGPSRAAETDVYDPPTAVKLI